jgi:hypothetical protein
MPPKKQRDPEPRLGPGFPNSRSHYSEFRNIELPKRQFIYCFRNLTVHPIDAATLSDSVSPTRFIEQPTPYGLEPGQIDPPTA